MTTEKKFTTSMNRKVCWEDGYKTAIKDVEKMIEIIRKNNKRWRDFDEVINYKQLKQSLKDLEKTK